MKILHIMAGRHAGGAETYSTDVMLDLQQHGVEQIIVMDARAPRFADMRAEGLRLMPEVLRGPFRFLHRWRLKRLIARKKPDIIHCWMRRAASLVPVEAKNSVPVIGWFGGYYNPARFRSCGWFVGVTPDIVAHMVAQGVPHDRACYIPTFPDIAALPPVDRAALDTPPNAKVFLTLSRLHPKKGLDVFLRAIASMPNVYAWLAGTGELQSDLEGLAKELGIAGRVRFLGWRTDRAALLRAADVCVLPSRYEPFGTVILEAWAAGVPLVACRSAGPAATITDGDNGLLVAIDDVNGLRDAMCRAATDESLRQKMIVAGRAAYEAGFTREAVMKQWLDFYSQRLREKA